MRGQENVLVSDEALAVRHIDYRGVKSALISKGKTPEHETVPATNAVNLANHVGFLFGGNIKAQRLER